MSELFGGPAFSDSAYTTQGGLALGTVRTDNYGNRYVYTEYVGGAGNVEALTGCPVGIYAPSAADGTIKKVTADLSDSGEDNFVGLAANDFTGAASTSYYGWVMIEGFLETGLNGAGITPTTGGSVAQGDALYWSADKVLAGLAVGGTPADHSFCGVAYAADTAAPVLAKGFITCNLNIHAAA